MRINVFFAWYDLWVGLYIDRGDRAVYVCFLPMLIIKIALLNAPIRLKRIIHRWHFVLHRSISFGKGKYPISHFVIFDYFDIGPLQIRRYVLEDWTFSQNYNLLRGVTFRGHYDTRRNYGQAV